jgi:uncharacterized protein YkwD
VKIVYRCAPLLLLTAVLAASPCAGAEEITQESILRTMNAYRKVNGLGPYVLDARMTAAAADRMRHMEELGYWAHKAPDGTPPFVWLEKRGFAFSMAGENLAEGFETVEVLVDSWMRSEGHRANILSPAYTSIGVAIIDGRVRQRAIGRSVVVLFARETVERIPSE